MCAAAERFTLGILSGGAGRRVGGVDKGLLEIEGLAQVQRVRLAFGNDPAAVLVSANRHLDRYRALGFTVVEDSLEGFQGPLAGVAALLAACATPWLLTVPVDAVQVPPDIAGRFMERCALDCAHVTAVRLRDDDGPQPTLALYRQALAAAAGTALLAGERSLLRWQAAIACVELDVTGRIGNRNEPSDYPDKAP